MWSLLRPPLLEQSDIRWRTLRLVMFYVMLNASSLQPAHTRVWWPKLASTSVRRSTLTYGILPQIKKKGSGVGEHGGLASLSSTRSYIPHRKRVRIAHLT